MEGCPNRKLPTDSADEAGFFVLFGLGRLVIGQADQGTITGLIQNPSGASIPGAAITLSSVDTGQALTAKVVVPLQPGAAPETISMAATASQMQTQESSISQVTNAQSINKVPLSGGNWVYIAQLSAGPRNQKLDAGEDAARDGSAAPPIRASTLCQLALR